MLSYIAEKNAHLQKSKFGINFPKRIIDKLYFYGVEYRKSVTGKAGMTKNWAEMHSSLVMLFLYLNAGKCKNTEEGSL